MQSDGLKLDSKRISFKITLFALWTSACLSMAIIGNYYPWLSNSPLAIIGLVASKMFWLLLVGALVTVCLQVINTVRAVSLYVGSDRLIWLVTTLSLMHVGILIIGYIY